MTNMLLLNNTIYIDIRVYMFAQQALAVANKHSLIQSLVNS